MIPLYVLGLLASYLSTRLITTKLFGQSSGTYDHYFNQFLPPTDIMISFVKVMVFALIVILTHCYYGYKASGGPSGVGVAVGRAVRLAITSVVVVDLLPRPRALRQFRQRPDRGLIAVFMPRPKRQPYALYGVAMLTVDRRCSRPSASWRSSRTSPPPRPSRCASSGPGCSCSRAPT